MRLLMNLPEVLYFPFHMVDGIRDIKFTYNDGIYYCEELNTYFNTFKIVNYEIKFFHEAAQEYESMFTKKFKQQLWNYQLKDIINE